MRDEGEKSAAALRDFFSFFVELTSADWNCHSEESEATRNPCNRGQISPPASSK